MKKAAKYLNRVYLKLQTRIYGFIGRISMTQSVGMRENEKSYVGVALGIIAILGISAILYGAINGELPTWLDSIFGQVNKAIN